MTSAWCVRADGGKFAEAFVNQGFVGIGWGALPDLSNLSNKEDLYKLYRSAYPQDVSNIVVGQQVGQISRFMFELRAGDVVITPDWNSELLRWGVIGTDPSYHYAPNDPSCPYSHRRWVKWSAETLLRSSLSVPLQNTLKSSLTVFGVSQVDEVLALAGQAPASQTLKQHRPYDPYEVVLNQILALDDKEFEILVSELLTALGFDRSEVVGKVGDGGVDAMGELDIANLAKVKIFVQAKRYKLGSKISASTVKQLRAAIPRDGQGAFITTAGFQKAAFDLAVDPRFPRIGLINGNQLVDLLVKHWQDITPEFQDRLGLKPGLVLA